MVKNLVLNPNVHIPLMSRLKHLVVPEQQALILLILKIHETQPTKSSIVLAKTDRLSASIALKFATLWLQLYKPMNYSKESDAINWDMLSHMIGKQASVLTASFRIRWKWHATNRQRHQVIHLNEFFGSLLNEDLADVKNNSAQSA